MHLVHCMTATSHGSSFADVILIMDVVVVVTVLQPHLVERALCVLCLTWQFFVAVLLGAWLAQILSPIYGFFSFKLFADLLGEEIIIFGIFSSCPYSISLIVIDGVGGTIYHCYFIIPRTACVLISFFPP